VYRRGGRRRGRRREGRRSSGRKEKAEPSPGVRKNIE